VPDGLFCAHDLVVRSHRLYHTGHRLSDGYMICVQLLGSAMKRAPVALSLLVRGEAVLMLVLLLLCNV
jgi:hypothetical protein